MGSYKKIGFSHEMGLIVTPPLEKNVRKTDFTDQKSYHTLQTYWM